MSCQEVNAVKDRIPAPRGALAEVAAVYSSPLHSIPGGPVVARNPARLQGHGSRGPAAAGRGKHVLKSDGHYRRRVTQVQACGSQHRCPKGILCLPKSLKADTMTAERCYVTSLRGYMSAIGG